MRLERRVLELLGERHGGARVRDLQPSFPSVAYTTLMTFQYRRSSRQER